MRPGYGDYGRTRVLLAGCYRLVALQCVVALCCSVPSVGENAFWLLQTVSAKLHVLDEPIVSNFGK